MIHNYTEINSLTVWCPLNRMQRYTYTRKSLYEYLSVFDFLLLLPNNNCNCVNYENVIMATCTVVWCHQGCMQRVRPSDVQSELLPYLTPPQLLLLLLLLRWKERGKVEGGKGWKYWEKDFAKWRGIEDSETDTAREGGRKDKEKVRRRQRDKKRGGAERGSKKQGEGWKAMCQQWAPERCKLGREETFHSSPLPVFPPPSPPLFLSKIKT